MTLSKIIEQLKAADQNKTGMFELGEDVMCALVELLERRERDKQEPFGYVVVTGSGAKKFTTHRPRLRVTNEKPIPVYTCVEPTTTVVAPDEIPKTPDGRGFKYVKDGIYYSANYANGWNACRAAMHGKAEPVSNPYKLPDGWIKCSERMPEEGGRYWCYVEEINSLGRSHYQWNCSWNGDEWGGEALSGRVTHWMPLPAAPGKEG